MYLVSSIIADAVHLSLPQQLEHGFAGLSSRNASSANILVDALNIRSTWNTLSPIGRYGLILNAFFHTQRPAYSASTDCQFKSRDEFPI